MQRAPNDPARTQPAWAALPLRLVIGWMFLSAFHRRVVLAPDKLVADSASYVGLKFNQFMPGAIFGVDGMIAALLDHPSALHTFMWAFTILEGLIGLLLIAGLFTRLSALGALLLSAGILLGAGWLGPTCLDEWQIGATGLATGSALMLMGGGPLSLDGLFAARFPTLFRRPWLRVAADPAPRVAPRAALSLAAASVLITLGTNQIFHGGLWGTLRNDSVRPEVVVSAPELLASGSLRARVERPKGPETYGAFIVEARVRDALGALVQRYDARALAALSTSAIENRWLVAVHTGPHGLIIPLGSRAQLSLPSPGDLRGPGPFTLELVDVSGAVFRSDGTFDAPRIARRPKRAGCKLPTSEDAAASCTCQDC